MTRTPTRDSADGQALHGQSSRRVVNQAIQAQAPVRLLIPLHDEVASATGILVGGDTATLILKLDGPAPAPDAIVPDQSLHVRLNIAGGPYVFETRVISGPTSRRNRQIVLQRPGRLSQIERRRSARRLLREPAEVELRTIDPVDGWEGTGAMLNVSPEGLACRLPDHESRRLTIGRRVRAAFRIGDPPQDFQTVCRITNLTLGGTAGTAIVGMGFVDDEREAILKTRLRAILESVA